VRRVGSTDTASRIPYGDRTGRPTGTATPHRSGTPCRFHDPLVAIGDLGAEAGPEAEIVRHDYSFVEPPAGLAVTGTTMRLSARPPHGQTAQSSTSSDGKTD
jgi:hypothetical protein